MIPFLLKKHHPWPTYSFRSYLQYQGLNEGKAGKGGVYGRGGRVIASRRGLTVRVPAAEGGMLACNGAVGKRRLRRW